MNKAMFKIKSSGSILLIFLLSLILISCENIEQKSAFELIKESITLPEEITGDIVLPTETDVVENATLSWTTNNHNVLSREGRFIRPDEDVLVKLELFVTIGIETQIFEYEILAKGWEKLKVDIETFKDPAGFASLGITDRKGLDNPDNDNYYIVNDEIEFLDAYIDSENKKDVVIEITSDLNMGARYIGKLLVEKGLWDGLNPRDTKYLDGKNFRENTNMPENHPDLLEHGVGQLIIDGRDGLMIYSKTGINIKYLTIQTKGDANNLVFRNLKLDGIWEWDEIDRGDYKALDWDYFTIEFTTNVWLDHITFGTAYDGIVDVKGGVSNLTLSWINMDFTVSDHIKRQFDVLESNIESYPFYRELRETVSREDIETVAAGQKKAFNFGNTEGGPNFESITATLHHIYAKNLQDRFPRLRRGDVHVYNVVLDAEELRQLRHIDMKVISQAIVPTEQGAVLMENSRFIGVNEPIKTHQSSNLDQDFTGRFKVVDSEYIYTDTYYYGSSEDGGFLNPWQRSNQNIDYDLDFYFRNYEEIPYEYSLDEANMLTKIFEDNLVGAGELPGFDWLEITGLIDPDEVDRGYKVDESKILGLEPHIAEINEPIQTFIPEIYNFYTGNKLVIDKDYRYYVDTTLVDITKPGFYEVEYTFLLLHNDTEVKYNQKYIIYDSELPNEVYDTNITKPFDHILSGKVNVFESSGTLYSYLSNNEIEEVSTVTSLGEPIEINETTVTFENLDVKDYSHLHFVVVSDDGISPVYTYEIEKETIQNINTIHDFNAMLIDSRSQGTYYRLMNDLDFTDFELHNLSADNIFRGVFDGQGYTIKNIDKHAYGGGIFHTITDGKIKNVVFENIKITVDRTPIYDDETGLQVGWQNTSARSGIVAGQIKGGAGIIENITIIDSIVKTNNNYGAIVVGKVEAYSDAIFTNITILNSEVDQDGEYAGGITAGVANNSKALFEDIYVNGLKVEERNSKMIGAVVGRAESAVTINRVVLINVELTTTSALGGMLGKDDRKGQNINTSITNVFVDIKNMSSESHYLGTIVGNPDINFGHPAIILNNTWGTPFEKGSSGINTQNEITLDEVNQAWWTENFSNLLETNLWELEGNLIVLKK